MTNKKNQIQTYTKSYANIFPYSLTIVHGGNIININEIAESLFKQGYIQMSYFLSNPMVGNIDACVYHDPNDTEIFLFISNNLTIDVLIHECVHITARIFDIIGSEITNDTEEFFAYINQFMFKECYDTITNKLNKKIGKIINYEEKIEEEK